MKLFKSRIDLYKDKGDASLSKRLIALIIDFFLLLMTTLLLYLGTNQIVINNQMYQRYEKQVKDEIAYYNHLLNETHIIDFNDDDLMVRYDVDSMALKLLSLHISLSYQKDANNDFTVVPKECLDVGIASINEDFLSYFYTVYVPKHNTNNAFIDFGGVDPLIYYKNLMKGYAGNQFDNYFIFGEEDELFYLRPYVANRIYHYYFLEEDKGESEYQYISQLFYYAIEEAELTLINSSPYYEEHYLPYREAYANQGNIINLAFLLTSYVAYLIIIVLPQLVFNDAVTLGKLAMGIAIISKRRQKLKWYFKLIRMIGGLLISPLSSLLIPVLPMFNFNFTTFNLPLLGSGFTYGWFLVILASLLLINGLVALFNHRHFSLMDYLTSSIVIDKNKMQEYAE